MLDSFIDRYSEATITRVQTTYLEVAVSTGVFRIQYRDKVEFVAKPSARGRLAQMWDHPLLWDYNGPCDTMYLATAALDPPHLVAELQRVVATVTQGWRSLECYLFLRPKASAVTLLTQNLADGKWPAVIRRPYCNRGSCSHCLSAARGDDLYPAARSPRVNRAPPT